MRLSLNSIGNIGLTIEGALPRDGINKRMNEGRNNDFVFTEDAKVNIVATLTANGVEINGVVSVAYTQFCSLCADAVKREANIPLKINFIKKKEHNNRRKICGTGHKEDKEEVGVYFVETDYVDLEEPIEEAIILSLYPYWHPDIDTYGVCVYCLKKVRCNANPCTKDHIKAMPTSNRPLEEKSQQGSLKEQLTKLFPSNSA